MIHTENIENSHSHMKNSPILRSFTSFGNLSRERSIAKSSNHGTSSFPVLIVSFSVNRFVTIEVILTIWTPNVRISFSIFKFFPIASFPIRRFGCQFIRFRNFSVSFRGMTWLFGLSRLRIMVSTLFYPACIVLCIFLYPGSWWLAWWWFRFWYFSCSRSFSFTPLSGWFWDPLTTSWATPRWAYRYIPLFSWLHLRIFLQVRLPRYWFFKNFYRSRFSSASAVASLMSVIIRRQLPYIFATARIISPIISRSPTSFSPFGRKVSLFRCIVFLFFFEFFLFFLLFLFPEIILNRTFTTFCILVSHKH